MAKGTISKSNIDDKVSIHLAMGEFDYVAFYGEKNDFKCGKQNGLLSLPFRIADLKEMIAEYEAKQKAELEAQLKALGGQS